MEITWTYGNHANIHVHISLLKKRFWYDHQNTGNTESEIEGIIVHRITIFIPVLINCANTIYLSAAVPASAALLMLLVLEELDLGAHHSIAWQCGACPKHGAQICRFSTVKALSRKGNNNVAFQPLTQEELEGRAGKVAMKANGKPTC